MTKCNRSVFSSFRASLVILILLATFAPWAQASAPTVTASVATAQAPVTLRGSWSFTEGVDVNTLPGMWLGSTSDNSQGKHSLALVWLPESSGWFPTWRLILASETGLLPDGDSKSYTIPGWQNSIGIDLGNHTPLPGHTYEPMLSYDPQNEALSVSLTDLTTGDSVQANGFRLKQAAGPLSVSSSLLGKQTAANQAVAISNLRTATEYIPAGTTWSIGVHEGSTFLQNSILNRKDAFYLKLNVAGPAPRGFYRVYLVHNGVQRELGIEPKVNGEILLPTAGMPIGKSQLVLEYTDQGRVVLSDALNFTFGQVTALYGDVTVDRNTFTATGSLQVSSSGPLSGINVDVKATVTEQVWDKTTRKYQEIVTKEEVINLARDLAIDGNGTKLPIMVKLPSRPSLWKLSLQPIISPDVAVVTSAITRTFNTYTAPVIEPDQPFTIAVLPDTQYLSGYSPVILDRMTQWMLEEADKQNIALMLHVGDITDRNTDDQWENAQRSISQLNGLIPYALALGNHDMSPIGRTGSITHRGESQFAKYFPAEYFAGLQGAYPEGRLDNTYHTVKINGVDYLVVSLEFAPPDDVLEWANKVVASYPTHKTIVITHYYLATNGLRAAPGASKSYPIGQDKTTTMNDGSEMWYKFVSKHKNMFMVINGHVNGVGVPYHIDKGVNGNTVYEFNIDYQDHTDGWLVTLQFTPDEKLNINAYSPYLDKNKTDVSKYGFTNRYQIDMKTGRISYKY